MIFRAHFRQGPNSHMIANKTLLEYLNAYYGE